MKNTVRYLRRNFDELSIAAILGGLAAKGRGDAFSDDELSVLAALRRASSVFESKTPDEIGEVLSDMDERQVVGLVSNVKGVLHEMEFVQIENADGDTVTASIFASTNHPDFDVMLFDSDNGTWSQLQLKATDSEGYVQSWIDAHPDGEILVTEEIAEKMDLPSSGFSNQQLTVRVEDFIDKLKDLEDPSVIDSLPLLAPISIAIASWESVKQWRQGRLTTQELQRILMILTGKKVLKLSVIMLLMSIPVVNVATGAALLAKLIFQGQSLFASQKTHA